MNRLQLPLTRHQVAEVATYLVGCLILWAVFPQLFLGTMIAADGLCDLTIGWFLDANHSLYGRVLVTLTILGFLGALWCLGYVVRSAVRALLGLH